MMREPLSWRMTSRTIKPSVLLGKMNEGLTSSPNPAVPRPSTPIYRSSRKKKAFRARLAPASSIGSLCTADGNAARSHGSGSASVSEGRAAAARFMAACCREGVPGLESAGLCLRGDAPAIAWFATKFQPRPAPSRARRRPKTKKTAPKGGLRRSKHARERGLGAGSSLEPSLACGRLSG